MKKQNHTILFVEDETETRQNYVRYLKDYFKNVYEASNGVEALQIYKNKKPDILILDINIPIINGLEVLQIIRKSDHSIRVILFTAHSDTDYLLKASELKLTKYLVKPVLRKELKNALTLATDELKHFKTTSNRIVHINDGFYWNHATKELNNNSGLVQLTPIERKTLELMFLNINNTLNYDDIIVYVWDDYHSDKLNSLKTAIKKLRKKLPENTIENVYSIGFVLRT